MPLHGQVEFAMVSGVPASKKRTAAGGYLEYRLAEKRSKTGRKQLTIFVFKT